MGHPIRAPRTGFRFMLTVKGGPEKGASFQLLPPRVTIGRGSDNSVSLADPRMSRNAAVIEFSMEKIIISDLSGRGLLVNGETVKISSLREGDIIDIGETQFVFIVEALELPAVAPPPPPPTAIGPRGRHSPPPMHAPPPHPTAAFAPPPIHGELPKMPTSDGKQMRFYMIVAVVLGVVIWLVMSETNPKKKDAGLKTVAEIEKEIAESSKKTETLAKRRTFRSEEEKTRFEEAQRHYLAGFRDYQKGQYTRAMRSFETARAIDPGHELSGRYYRLAEKQRDEMIAQLVLEGRRYKEKSMYKRCSAAFEKVLDAIPNNQDMKYKTAAALKKECDLLGAERFR